MKKLFMVAMAIVVAAGFVACTKEDVSAPTYKVEFTVGDKGGFGVNSRAVKNAWAEGDQVAVVFEVENAEEELWISPLAGEENIMRLEFNGSNWVITKGVTAELAASGRYAAYHHRVKDGKDIAFDSGDMGVYSFVNYYGGEITRYVGNFTNTGNVLALGTIEMAVKNGMFQVSVPGITDDANWNLTICKATFTSYIVNFRWANGMMHFQKNCANMREDNGLVGTWGNEYYYYKASYVVNGNDASFVFSTSNNTVDEVADPDTYGKYVFVLYNQNTGLCYKYVVDRNLNAGEYDLTLEGGKAYGLPEFDGGNDGETKWKRVIL